MLASVLSNSAAILQRVLTIVYEDHLSEALSHILACPLPVQVWTSDVIQRLLREWDGVDSPERLLMWSVAYVSRYISLCAIFTPPSLAMPILTECMGAAFRCMAMRVNSQTPVVPLVPV